MGNREWMENSVHSAGLVLSPGTQTGEGRT